jgi:solute carrier family 10 (sodium/bile acid cotransporter), member 7
LLARSRLLARFRPDVFTLALVGAVVLASLLPLEGKAGKIFGVATSVAIALLFFLHGARLSRDTVVAGATHWRLHLCILAATFVLFPALGFLVSLTMAPLLTPALASGVLFLSVLPSTVQSSIAFTSIAGGNVPAAVCAATASNILGMVFTPVLVGLLFSVKGVGISTDVLFTIFLQLLLPFLVGQALQPRIGNVMRRHRRALGFIDRGSILMVVYLAFSEAVATGLWHQFSLRALAAMIGVDVILLVVVLLVTTWGCRCLGFSRGDEIAIVFCGSKKSLASGVPMANVIFSGHTVGAIVLPVMLFHQIQLMVCAWLAKRYAERDPARLAAAAPPERPTAIVR